MSVRAMTHVFYDSEADGFDRLVLLALADEADDVGGNCFPSLPRLALKARCHRDTVIEAVKRLEAAGELLVLRPATHGRGRHNRYQLTMGRNPHELAVELRWPAPLLSAAAVEKWSGAPTNRADGGPDQDLDTMVGDSDVSARPPTSVDNRHTGPGMVGATPRNGRDGGPKRSDPSDLTPLPVDRPAPSTTPSASTATPPAPPAPTPDRFVRGLRDVDGELVGAGIDAPRANPDTVAAAAAEARRAIGRPRVPVAGE